MKRVYTVIGFATSIGLLSINGGCDRPSGTHRQTSAAERVTADQSNSESTVRVTAGKPERKTLRRTTSQPGHIEAFEQTPLYVKVSGYVREVRADIGDRVEKDQLLANLSLPEMDEELNQKKALMTQCEAEIEQAAAAARATESAVLSAQARVRETQAGIVRTDGEYERWKAEHDRVEKLAADGAVTRKLVEETLNQFRAADAARREASARIESAKAALSEAEANVEKARADQAVAAARLKVAQTNLARMKALLEYANIRAPFAGVLTERNVDTGHFVQPPRSGNTKPLFVVARTDIVRIFVHVPELESALVHPGDTAWIRVQALRGQEIEGKVTRTSWLLDPVSRTLRTEIDVPNTDGRLRPGMYAHVRILLEERSNVLAVPASAIVTDGGQTLCYCVEAGKVVRKAIILGLWSGDEVEVLSGLNDEEMIIQAGGASLREDQPVEVIR